MALFSYHSCIHPIPYAPPPLFLVDSVLLNGKIESLLSPCPQCLSHLLVHSWAQYRLQELKNKERVKTRQLDKLRTQNLMFLFWMCTQAALLKLSNFPVSPIIALKTKVPFPDSPQVDVLQCRGTELLELKVVSQVPSPVTLASPVNLWNLRIEDLLNQISRAGANHTGLTSLPGDSYSKVCEPLQYIDL